MAWINEIKRKHRTVYKAVVRIAGHKPISQTFDRKSDALRWAEDVEDKLRNGGYIGDDPPGDLAIKTAIHRYLDEISSKKAPLTTDRDQRSAAPLLVHFAGQTLRGITPAMVAQYRDARIKVVSPSTLQKELAILSHLYNVARAEWSLDMANPVQGVRKPSTGPGRLRLLDEGEILRLLDACKKSRNPKLYAYVLLQLHTGMRPSEGAGLTWKQVDLDKRVLDLTKTKTEPRRVPLTHQAVEVLADLVPEGDCSGDDYVFLPGKISKMARLRPSIYFRMSYEHALARARIKDFTMHDLRHTAASWMIMSGMDIRTLAEVLGHKTMQMVQRYTHLLDDHKLKAVDLVGMPG